MSSLLRTGVWKNSLLSNEFGRHGLSIISVIPKLTSFRISVVFLSAELDVFQRLSNTYC